MSPPLKQLPLIILFAIPPRDVVRWVSGVGRVGERYVILSVLPRLVLGFFSLLSFHLTPLIHLLMILHYITNNTSFIIQFLGE